MTTYYDKDGDPIKKVFAGMEPYDSAGNPLWARSFRQLLCEYELGVGWFLDHPQHRQYASNLLFSLQRAVAQLGLSHVYSTGSSRSEDLLVLNFEQREQVRAVIKELHHRNTKPGMS